MLLWEKVSVWHVLKKAIFGNAIKVPPNDKSLLLLLPIILALLCGDINCLCSI
jgi:hypothetical protein